MARARRQTQRKETGVKGARILVVEARYYDDIADLLLRGAKRVLKDAQATFDLVTVPGALEIPAAIMIGLHAAAAREQPYDGVVALGCVIRGDTPHFDYVAGECARGLMDAGLQTGVPVIFGVLTTENPAQAEERADVTRMNKGRESMEAALEMIQLLAPPPRTPRAGRKKGARA